MARTLCCLLAPTVLGAGAEEAGNDEAAVDKSGFHLFNRTPTQYLRVFTRDGPGKTESPYTVDAGHFQIEMDLVSYTFDKDSTDGVTQRLDAWAIARMNLKIGLLNQLD